MKHLKIKFTLLFCVFFAFANAQKDEKTYNFTKIDAITQMIPTSKTVQLDTLAAYLSSISNKPRDKARAIYVWITTHITYDYALVDTLSTPWAAPSVIYTQLPDAVLWNRKAVCQGFAELFKALADRMKLRAEVVVGAVKDENGEVPRFGHAWNVVKIGSEWELIDATWGISKDGVINEEYFCPKPETFIVNHLPFDPMWQLTINPLDFDTFKASDNKKIEKLFNKNPKKDFVFIDTISRYFRQDTLVRLLKSSDRMLRFNPENEYVTFEIGKANYYRFIQLSEKMNKKLMSAIELKNLDMDSLRFEYKIAVKWAYYKKAVECYNSIKDVAFAKKIESGLYTDRQIDALKSFDRGMFYTGVYIAKEEVERTNLLGVKDLEVQSLYAFKHFRTALVGFDTLNKTKFKEQTLISLIYPIHIKQLQIKTLLSYLERFLDFDDNLLKFKPNFKAMINSCELHNQDIINMNAKLKHLDSTLNIERVFPLHRFLIDFTNLQFEAQTEYLEDNSRKIGYNLVETKEKESFYEDIVRRIANQRENLKSGIIKENTNYFFSAIESVELLNALGLTKTYINLCLLQNDLSADKKNSYISKAEYQLQIGEKIFKNTKGQNEKYYKTNQAYIDNCKNEIAKLKK